MRDTSSALLSRANLLRLLHQASEAEHSLCCQYLYAAFSLRRHVADFPEGTPVQTIELVMSATQRWAYQIFYVARQEMEHLGIATNLLAAIGERPYFTHGDYPDPKLADILQTEMVLRRCDEDTLRRFQFIERPVGVLPGPAPSVETIYRDINDHFQHLPAGQLFTGEGERQVSPTDVSLGLSMQIFPVTNRASAAQAINLVLTQGEGVSASPLSIDTHFARFTEILQDYIRITKGHNIAPSLPVVENPVSQPSRSGTTLVTHPFSAALMDLFNAGYRLMLIMLKEFFWGFRGYSGFFQAVEALATEEQQLAQRRVVILSENAYYPFMTMFIRPIGELLARQPAFTDARDPARASASFQTGGEIPIWTDMDRYLQAISDLTDQTWSIAKEAPDPAARDVLTYLAQNLQRMHANIARVWSQGA